MPWPGWVRDTMTTAIHSIAWTTRDILAATGGELLCGDLACGFAGISIDSRTVSQGDVFVAIVGDVHDGHAFVQDAIRQGSGGVMIDKRRVTEFPLARWREQKIAAFAVADTTRSLGDLGAFHRQRMPASVIAITGSNGKTTTRKLTAGVVATRFNTLATIGNYNNHIGLPLTLLRLNREHVWAVVELGTNNPGEIARLAEICRPEIGVITNIGPAHLEGLGSLDGVLREKGDLLQKLKPGGKAVLNSDDLRLRKLAAETDKDVIFYGVSDDAFIRAQTLTQTATGISFTLMLPQEHIRVNLSISGRFMVANALAAAAVGYVTGLSPQQIKAGLEEFHPGSGRMNVFETPNGIHIIDDTYNANPESMRVAIETLKTIGGDSRRIFISGDMLELGDQAAALHQQLGALAATSGIRKIYVTGKFAAALASGAMDAHMDASDIFVGTKEKILETLKNDLRTGDWILIKGSRGMAMEDIVKGLKTWAGMEDR